MIAFTVSQDVVLAVLMCLVLFILFFVILLVQKFVDWNQNKQRMVHHQAMLSSLEMQLEKARYQLRQLTIANNERSNYINSVFATMEDGVVVVNHENEVLLINPAARAFLDVSNEILFRKVQGDEKKLLLSTLQACQQTIDQREIQSLCIEETGRYFDITTSIIWNRYAKSDMIGVLASVKDVTQRKRVESLRKEFVTNVSHEFRTPITLISGFIEMLKIQDEVTADERRRAFEIIEVETERLKHLISELLSLSQIEGSLNNENESYIDIEEMMERIVMALTPLAMKKEIVLLQEVDIDYPLLMGNEHFLYQAISNLVENAIKYTPERGMIVLRVFCMDQMIHIEVQDNGIGIPAQELGRIFERFYRVDPTRSSQSGGSGIGLSIVKNVVSMFHGEVSVESEVGSGSLFRIQIPVMNEP